MLFFTNRIVQPGAAGASAFTGAYKPMEDELSFATVGGSPAGWSLAGTQPAAGDDAIVKALVGVFNSGKPVLLYIHGNNNTPAKAFARCHWLKELYPVNMIGFSWCSEGLQPDGSELAGLDPKAQRAEDEDEDSLAKVKPSNISKGWIHGKIRHYRQAKANAQDSTVALARFLRLVAVARLYAPQQKLAIAVHSLGCHFLQKAIDLDGVQAAMASATNVLLLAACASNEKHGSWVGKINPQGQLFITFHKGDSVLGAAGLADGDVKFGAQPGVDVVKSPKARYIDFQGSPAGLGAHAYFVAKDGKQPDDGAFKLFTRLFTSQRDFDAGGEPKPVYPVGCNEARTVCYMGSQTQPDGGPN